MKPATGRTMEQRPGSLPAFTLFGLAAVPCPPRHFELEPGLPGLDRLGAVLDPRTAFFRRLHSHVRQLKISLFGSFAGTGS